VIDRELGQLASRMEKILRFNLRCFRDTYGLKGMVIGK